MHFHVLVQSLNVEQALVLHFEELARIVQRLSQLNLEPVTVLVHPLDLLLHLADFLLVRLVLSVQELVRLDNLNMKLLLFFECLLHLRILSP